MREPADELAKPLSIIYQPWLTGEVPEEWKLASVTLIHKKGGKKDAGNYKPVSLTSEPGKVLEQFILSLYYAAPTGWPEYQTQPALV